MRRHPTFIRKCLLIAAALAFSANTPVLAGSLPVYGDLPGVTFGSEFNISPDYSFNNVFGNNVFGSSVFGPGGPGSLDGPVSGSEVTNPGSGPPPPGMPNYSQVQFLTPGFDLPGFNLPGLNLYGLNLYGSNLSGSNLSDPLQTTSSQTGSPDETNQNVPEPGTSLMLAFGLLGALAFYVVRRSHVRRAKTVIPLAPVSAIPPDCDEGYCAQP